MFLSEFKGNLWEITGAIAAGVWTNKSLYFNITCMKNDFFAGNAQSEFEAQLDERISAMENGDYKFPPRLGRRDYIFAAIVGAVCLILVIAGGWL